MVAYVLVTGLAPAVLFGQHQDVHTILEGSATIAVVSAMLIGALQTSGDIQNGMTRAVLLVQPRRIRLVAAQLLIGLLIGLAVGITAATLSDATQSILGRLNLSTSALVSVGLGTVLAATLAGALGAALGIAVRNAAVAGIAVVAWSYALEPFISSLSYSVYIYLPGGAREALVQHVSSHHYIPPPATGGLILLAETALVAVVAALTFVRRDIS
jgi:ABC-2 type transport system permease protein